MDSEKERQLQALAEIIKDPSADAELKSRAAERMKSLDEAPPAPAPVATEPEKPIPILAGWPGMTQTMELPAEPHPWQDRPVDRVMESRNSAAIGQYLAKNPNAVKEHCTIENLFGKGK